MTVPPVVGILVVSCFLSLATTAWLSDRLRYRMGVAGAAMVFAMIAVLVSFLIVVAEAYIGIFPQ